MKKQNEDKIPEVKKEGWDAEKIAEEATNAEDEDIVGRMQKANDDASVPDKLKVAPTDDENNDSQHGRGTYSTGDKKEE